MTAPRLLAEQAQLAAKAAAAPAGHSAVALVKGEDRRRNVAEALAMVEAEILPVLRQKKYVVIKPNLVSLDPAAGRHPSPTRSTASSISSPPASRVPW